MNMILKTKREWTSEVASPKKFFPDVTSEEFTREQAQTVNSINTNFNLLDEKNKLAFAHLKMEKNFTYEYPHWGTNKNLMDSFNK